VLKPGLDAFFTAQRAGLQPAPAAPLEVLPHVRVFQGALEILQLPGGTTLNPAASSLTLTPGTVWVQGARLSAGTPANAWIGILVKGGSLDFPPASLFLDGTLVVAASASLTLRIELDPPVVAGPAAGPGAEAANSDAHLPATATFVFGPFGVESIAIDDASLTAFGATVALSRSADSAFYESTLRILIVPMTSDVPSFQIAAVQSTLFRPAGTAGIARSGWALPVTIAQPASLTTAIGAGSLVLELLPGLETTWGGLHGGPHRPRQNVSAGRPGVPAGHRPRGRELPW
jgi:hypothetical protein